MAEYEAETGGRAFAIAHNGNLSNGLMFDDVTLSGEVLAPVLLTRHNVQFFLDLMRQIRQAISADSLDGLRERIVDAGD